MAREFSLSVVAPDREVVTTQVVSVVAPGVEGYFGVLAGHVPIVSALRPGLLEYMDASNQRHFVSVGGGFAEVANDKMTVLADEAQLAQDIDLAKAEEMLERARRALRGESSELNTEQAQEEMERAMQRIRAARQLGR